MTDPQNLPLVDLRQDRARMFHAVEWVDSDGETGVDVFELLAMRDAVVAAMKTVKGRTVGVYGVVCHWYESLDDARDSLRAYRSLHGPGLSAP